MGPRLDLWLQNISELISSVSCFIRAEVEVAYGTPNMLTKCSRVRTSLVLLNRK